MKEQFMYGEISVKVSLPQRINVVRGNSGMGKTFLAKVLRQLVLKGYDVVSIRFDNYKAVSCEQISTFGDNTLLIIDNADLYMSKELQHAILNNTATCLIYTRDTRFFNITNSALCVVRYVGKELSIREFRYEDNF